MILLCDFIVSSNIDRWKIALVESLYCWLDLTQPVVDNIIFINTFTNLKKIMIFFRKLLHLFYLMIL